MLSRVIAIGRAEWGIHMATNPASGRFVKRPAPQDGDVRDRRLAEVHVGVKGNPPPAPDPAGQGGLPAKSGPASRRVRPDDAYEDDPEITALLAMPQSEQRALRILATQTHCGEFVFDTNAVKLAFKRARTRVGSEDLRVHDLRHESTSRLFEQTDLRANEIGHVTGHTDPRMPERYYNKRPGEFVERFRRSFK